jgi:hypothetical protein
MENNSVEKPLGTVEKPSALEFNAQKSSRLAISCQRQKETIVQTNVLVVGRSQYPESITIELRAVR